MHICTRTRALDSQAHAQRESLSYDSIHKQRHCTSVFSQQAPIIHIQWAVIGT